MHQSLLHPPRALFYLYVCCYSCVVSRAELRLLDVDSDIVRCRSACFALRVCRRIVNALFERRGALSGHTCHAQAVRSVRRDLEVDHIVIKIHALSEVHARLEADVLRKRPDAFSVSYRNDLVIVSELSARADDAVRCLALDLSGLYIDSAFYRRLTVERSWDVSSREAHRHQHALLDVRRSADDLDVFAPADIYHAYRQPVRKRVLFKLVYLSDHDVPHLSRQLFDRLEIGSAHDHPVCELSHIYINFCIIFQPFDRY